MPRRDSTPGSPPMPSARLPPRPYPPRRRIRAHQAGGEAPGRRLVPGPGAVGAAWVELEQAGFLQARTGPGNLPGGDAPGAAPLRLRARQPVVPVAGRQQARQHAVDHRLPVALQCKHDLDFDQTYQGAARFTHACTFLQGWSGKGTQACLQCQGRVGPMGSGRPWWGWWASCSIGISTCLTQASPACETPPVGRHEEPPVAKHRIPLSMATSSAPRRACAPARRRAFAPLAV